MSNIERLTEHINACKNPRKVLEAVNALAPIFREHREELMQSAQPVETQKRSTMTAREEFNKMLNDSVNPRLAYNVLAALATTEIRRKTND